MTTQSTESPQSTVSAQAQAIRLAREARMLTELLAELTPYEGHLPATMEQYRALPAAHQRQLARAHAEHVTGLSQVETLLARSAQADRREEARRSTLAGLPVESPADFAALDAEERAQLAMTLTGRQRRALYGETPEEHDGAFL